MAFPGRAGFEHHFAIDMEQGAGLEQTTGEAMILKLFFATL